MNKESKGNHSNGLHVREFSLVAAPGAGKKTNTDLAVKYAQDLRGDKIAVIETGAVLLGIKDKAPQFRRLSRRLNPDSLKKITSGDLVPDDEIIDIVDTIESGPEYKNAAKIIRDGFPRTVSQAEALDQKHQTPKKFINLELTDNEALFRQHVRTVGEMLTMFEEEDMTPHIDVLDCIKQHDLQRIENFVDEYIETALDLGYVSRPDARPKTCRKRLRVYRDLTHPVLDYAAATGRLVVIDAMRSQRAVGIDFMKTIGYNEFSDHILKHGFHPHPQLPNGK